MIKKDKLAQLMQQQRRLFHTQDLAVIWSISKPNTLYTTIQRYIARGLLFRIQKGLYSILPVEKIDPYELGYAAIHEYAYCSGLTVLQQEGLINQPFPQIHFMSSVSRQFTLAGHRYSVHQLQEHFLLNNAGIETMASSPRASVARAIADQLYINPRTHFDAPVDWGAIRAMQESIGYPLTQRT